MTSTCALCFQERKLCESHIIPEFLYSALYDSKHRMHLVARDKPGSTWKQKGYKECLLCEECEAKISQWERYAKRALQGNLELRYRKAGRIVYVSGLNYDALRMFQLSILWRAAVSSLAFFEKVRLGPHEEILRQLVLAEDPGKHLRYACVMFGLRMNENDIMRAVVQPTRVRSEGRLAYRFIFGGFLWMYFVSSRDITGPLAATVLQPNGELIFTIQDAAELKELLNFSAGRNRAGSTE